MESPIVRNITSMVSWRVLILPFSSMALFTPIYHFIGQGFRGYSSVRSPGFSGGVLFSRTIFFLLISLGRVNIAQCGIRKKVSF